MAMPSNFTKFAQILLEKQDSTFCHQHTDFCRKNRVLFLEKGHYAAHVKEWQRVYGRENVLIINMKDDQTQTVQRILELVGTDILPPKEYPWMDLQDPDISFHNSAYKGRSSASATYASILQQLQKYYHLHNEELSRMLGYDFPLKWNRAFDRVA